MSKYKLVAIDLDGTLLTPSGQILESSKAAIQAARNVGIKVAIVTGRHHVAAYPYHFELGLDTPAICCNGTYIMDYHRGERLLDNPLSLDQAEKILGLAKQMDMHVLMYTDKAMTYEVENEHMTKFAAWVNGLPLNVRPALLHIESAQEEMQKANSVVKFVLSHDDAATFQNCYGALQAMEDLSAEKSWFDRVDVANAGNSKGNALLQLAQLWDIAPEEIVAIGDNDNDVSMLEVVGAGVAMSNATQGAKEAAAFVTSSNEDGGIAEIFEKIIL